MNNLIEIVEEDNLIEIAESPTALCIDEQTSLIEVDGDNISVVQVSSETILEILEQSVVVSIEERPFVLEFSDAPCPSDLSGEPVNAICFDRHDISAGQYYFYGGEKSSGEWKINRYNRIDLERQSAEEITNESFSTLEDAWTQRLSLDYI